ncbi:pentatricopeptide repeat-containing protein At2g13600 [Ananas comosus]|uniref:Pentatricopeptide repeat-containing protein n=1 Tax=Ananas comosus TaxID=4615 RepID=A0A199ULD5_ANACO|nr:pentatricopeptide repeat-containing protein At2g13600 [Ananas comosus]XP_020106852.1 pentatricopeptide repeat-containing protein At2g13600 [Ananas comosus]XP_020106853.1 pentatricopeptide repeat-containing protein At2g13600 [Ananas comosus]XP_020106855.1 pentatricopeptide repeat-containing protein At2g13600 [Ananas comosus]OAY65521.1 Pentatricopeptide repeat-containing protein [Ananas comosus]
MSVSKDGMGSNASLVFSKHLRDLSVLPNSTFFAHLLQSCIDSASLRSAKRVHARLLKTRFSSETFILNRLIDAYAKCGSLDYARNLFDAMPQRNAFSWNALIGAFAKVGFVDEARRLFCLMPEPDQCSWNSMISGFSQCGMFGEALAFFAEMHAEDFVLNAYSFSSALSACSGLVDSRIGAQIHGLISKLRLVRDVYMGSALLDMYSKCKRPSDALRVFEEMPERNVVSWNTLITCYEQNGPVNKAVLLFVAMMKDGIKYDEVTLASVVSACASLSAIREGMQIHTRAIKFDKFRNDMILSNALVDMYAKCKRIREARSIFDRMPFKSVVAETSMISGYAKSSSVEDARLMFLGMPERNIIAWNALIAGYTQNGEDEEALDLFLHLKRESVWPTHYTYGNILNACANISDLHLGKQTHAHVLKHGFRFEPGPESDIFVGNSLIDMYLKCGSIDESEKVFERMIGRDKVTWNAMIVGCAQNGRGKEALHIFDRMLASGENPDHVTMIGVLSGCSHAGLVDQGRQYFWSMTELHGIIPSQDHYTCMVDLLGRAGHLKEVEELIKEMQIKPDVVLWNSLLAACRLHDNVELGEWVAEKLFELDSENSGPYVLLSNMYARMGRWADVVRLRRRMKERGVAKQPGCSWIEISRKVHVFLVRDKRHPCRKDIYGILRILKLQMKMIGLDSELYEDINYSFD